MGGTGSDLLAGGAGRDSLERGSGADVFDVRSTADLGNGLARDVITVFVSGLDRIDLVDLNLSFVGTGAFTVAGQVRFDAATSLLLIETTGDRVANDQVELRGVTSLHTGDLLL